MHCFSSVLLQVVTTAQIMLTAFYLAVIKPELSFLHGGVALLIMIELFLCRGPVVSYHVQVTLENCCI